MAAQVRVATYTAVLLVISAQGSMPELAQTAGSFLSHVAASFVHPAEGKGYPNEDPSARERRLEQRKSRRMLFRTISSIPTLWDHELFVKHPHARSM